MEIINMDKLQFRKFNIKDTSKCSELAVDAWPVVSAVASKEDTIKFMNVLIDLSRLFSTWLEVVCISENIIGFLFGRIDSDYRMKDKFKAFFSILSIVIKIIVGGYGRISKRFTLLRKLILTEIKVVRNRPKSDGEVTLFVVDSKYRGKGIGRMLMDRFIDTVKSKNARVITVYTEQGSNWKFYEIYGFRKYSTFYDDLTSYVRNEDVKGFIYAIDLQ